MAISPSSSCLTNLFPPWAHLHSFLHFLLSPSSGFHYTKLKIPSQYTNYHSAEMPILHYSTDITFHTIMKIVINLLWRIDIFLTEQVFGPAANTIWVRYLAYIFMTKRVYQNDSFQSLTGRQILAFFFRSIGRNVWTD